MLRSALILSAFLVAAPVHADPAEADVDAVAARNVGADTPGLAILVTRNGHVVFAKGYGYADLDRRIPVTADTVFDLASVSKQITAQLVLKDVLSGALDLSQPVEAVLPGFRQHDDGRAITPNDLLHHVSGLANYLNDYDPSQTDDDVLTYANEQSLDFEPGTQFEYNDTGFVLLADIVTRLGGAKDYGQLLERDIFAPLGMTETSSPFPAADLRDGQAAKGYRGTGGDFELSHSESITYGDGNVFSSLNDLARYEAAFFDGALIGKSNVSKLFVPGTFDDGTPAGSTETASYAFGWFVSSTASGRRIAYHPGGWSGTATYYERDLDTGLSVIVLANGEDYDAQRTADAIREAYEGE